VRSSIEAKHGGRMISLQASSHIKNQIWLDTRWLSRIQSLIMASDGRLEARTPDTSHESLSDISGVDMSVLD